MEDTIFTKIIKGDIPSYKVYEDEKTFAFLDIHPLTDGHVLVVPKQQAEFIWDLESDDYQALMDTVNKIGKRLREVLDAPYVGVEVIGVDVPHAHVHLIPFDDSADMVRANKENGEPDHDALAALAKQLYFE